MNAFAGRLRLHWQKRLGWWLLATGLGIYFFVPISTVLDTSLDGSNYANYIRFAAEQRQFGTEVVPMAGPYGFVFYGWVYSGDLYVPRLVLELMTKFIFGLLVLWCFQRIRAGVTGWIWLLGNLLVLPTTGELTYDLSVLYAALFLLFQRPRWILSLLTVSFLAFLALCKGTQLIFTLAVLAVVCGEAAWRRAWRDLGMMLLGFFAALILLWCAAGQNLSNLPAYIRNIQELSTGYVSGMALQESTRTFVVGVVSFILLMVGLILVALPHRREPLIIAATVVLAGFAFLQWKHGFVRADGHVFLFFHYCILGNLIALVLERLADGRVHHFGVRATLCGFAAVLALYGDGEYIKSRFREYGRVLIKTPAANLQQIFQPGESRTRFESILATHRVRYALPEVAHRVGRSSIGFFGYQSGYLPLNGLNERSSPVAGGGPFSVFTPHLQQLNAQHIRSTETRPDFYLLKLQTIDGRHAPQDDAPSLNLLMHAYRPVMAERGMLLYRSNSGDGSPPPLRQVLQVRFRPGEAVEVPAVADDEMVLAAFDLPWSALGMVRAALYKSPIVTLRLSVPGAEMPLPRRIIPSMASAPFILSPLLESTEDILMLHTEAPGVAVRSIQVTAEPGNGLEAENCAVTFYAQRRPRPISAELHQKISEQFLYPMANRAPAEIEGSNAVPRDVDGRKVQLLEPPGVMTFTLRGDERELLFDYGFHPESYIRGKTDGADFSAEVVFPEGSPELIFFSRREPLTTPADRGRHHAKIWLPLFKPGALLRLKTGRGRTGAGDWDWTYFDNIRLHEGPLKVEQFPGFSVAPTSVDGAAPRMFKHDNRPVLLLNAPGQLVFELNGTERSVQFSSGLIPGSYTEGNTDGVEFIVEVQRTDGTIEHLRRRWLQPKTNEADRGTQLMQAALPPLSPGARLIVRITPGPHGDLSWDWSYVADFRLE